MIQLTSLSRRISEWAQEDSRTSLKIIGPNASFISLLLKALEGEKNSSRLGKTLLIMPNEHEWDALRERVKDQRWGRHKISFFASQEHSPYSGIYSSEHTLLEQLKSLENIYNDEADLLITYHSALASRVVPHQFFSKNLQLQVSDIISHEQLASKLLEIGLSRTPTTEEPGSFSFRGEIFDIMPFQGGRFRLQYFDDMIEEITEIRGERGQKTSTPLEAPLSISPGPWALCSEDFRKNLRQNLPQEAGAGRERYQFRSDIFKKLSEGQLFENYPYYAPCFFENAPTLWDVLAEREYLPIAVNLDLGQRESFDLYEKFKEDFDHYKTSQNIEIYPDFEKIYGTEALNFHKNRTLIELNSVHIDKDFSEELDPSVIKLDLDPSNVFFKKKGVNDPSHKKRLQQTTKVIAELVTQGVDCYFYFQNIQAKKELQYLLGLQAEKILHSNHLHFKQETLDDGFFYPSRKLLIFTEKDLFSKKQQKTTKKKSQHENIDLFAEQISTLKAGDFVVHADFGIGQYLGLEALDVTGKKSDFLVLLYKDNDKVYVPVYKMGLVQKHADAQASVSLTGLRTQKFQNAKLKAKESAKKLAFDLLRLQAQRQTSSAYAFSAPSHDFKQFELEFPFKETPDQLTAIENVLEAMQTPTPMDFLVCGDVGFGKTEIAMRAAFKAVLDGKQVAVLVPTTVLAFQHYNSFKRRFQNFPVNIELVSRFRSTKETNEIIDKLGQGQLDIVVGTHKLLSKRVKYKDLGLVIIDEEQRFGVGHKEQLKLLRSTIDFLTLTATPIPRTLQLAFLGLKDLALIKTAPPKRQSIKSYLIKDDDLTIKTAIEKELNRGGQVFFVHNRVQDMEKVHRKIEELVPKAKIIVGHGQLDDKDLEKRMKDFYEGHYNVLLSTTIIESGIDIANANTMIIDRADTYGLAQLHQLRGRIGRSERKGYCYFMIPPHKKVSAIAEKRLKALQTYADIGAGFSIASCDLEIRGAGDILGAGQSGHIEGVGLELYMELLGEAIAEIRGEKVVAKAGNIEVNTPLPAYIPNSFIQDSGERLKIYKQLSKIESKDQAMEIEEDIADKFGPFPDEMKNLVSVVAARTYLTGLGVKTLTLTPSSVILDLDKKLLDTDHELREKVVQTFMSRPKTYQFDPRFKVIMKHKQDLHSELIEELAKKIAADFKA